MTQNILAQNCFSRVARATFAALLVFAQGATAATILPTHVIPSIGYTNTDSTVGRASAVNTLPPGASDYMTVAGPDIFYIFRVVIPGSMTFTVTPTLLSGFDVSLYLSSSDAIDAGLATGVFLGSDSGVEDEPETFTIPSLGAGVYFLAVDSFYPNGSLDFPSRHQGGYTLNVSGTAGLGDPFAALPEPSTWLMMAAGVVSLGLKRWRKAR